MYTVFPHAYTHTHTHTHHTHTHIPGLRQLQAQSVQESIVISKALTQIPHTHTHTHTPSCTHICTRVYALAQRHATIWMSLYSHSHTWIHIHIHAQAFPLICSLHCAFRQMC